MSFLFRWWSSPKDSSSSSIPPSSSSPDERQQQFSTPPPPPPPPPATDSTTTQQLETQLQPLSRIPNNLKLLVGGSIFFLLSTVVTRRALHRRRIASIPPFYTGSMYHKPYVNGAMEAFEALNIATINVVSLAMLGVGGTMYALDVNTIDDLRRLMRRGMGIEGTPGPSDRQLEEELEEWLATVLDKKLLEKKLKEIKEQEGEQQQRTDEKER